MGLRRSPVARVTLDAGEEPYRGYWEGSGCPVLVRARGYGGVHARHAIYVRDLYGWGPDSLEDIQIQQFGFDKTTFVWFCAFKNNKATAVQVKASVLCLKPAL
jgi:hypothetical protein